MLKLIKIHFTYNKKIFIYIISKMYLDIYIFLFFLIILFICFYSYRKKNIEHFNGVSEYPKKFIMQNCQMNFSTLCRRCR